MVFVHWQTGVGNVVNFMVVIIMGAPNAFPDRSRVVRKKIKECDYHTVQNAFDNRM